MLSAQPARSLRSTGSIGSLRSLRLPRVPRLALFATVCVALVISGVAVAAAWPSAPHQTAVGTLLPHQLDSPHKEAIQGTPAPVAAGEQFIPILMYHYTPGDFDQQLSYLQQAGYTAVDLGQVATALSGTGSLPPKPVVITFDDGFADQLAAFEALKRHGMKATYYVINGGPLSQWCIGSGRRHRDSMQPPLGCGDAYLTWDQVRELDRSGLITIGGHTVDHMNLATLSPEEQRYQIVESKLHIEKQLGHPIHDFAYPYGSYTDTTIQIVQESGYRTAVTTMPGDHQIPGQPYTLRRVRDAYSLL